MQIFTIWMVLLTENSGVETILNPVILFSAAAMWADSHLLIILCTKKEKKTQLKEIE